MAAKPLVGNARWSETVGGTPGPNLTAPNSGQRDSGWSLNQIGVSSFFNVLAHEAYLWFKYLSDGALTGNHSIAGDLTVTGALIADSGALTRGPQDRIYEPNSAWTHPFTISATTGYAQSVTGTMRVPLSKFAPGERLVAVATRVVDNNPSSHITMKLFRLDDTAAGPTGVQVGATQTSVNAGVQLLTLSGLTESFVAGRTYYVELVTTHVSHELRRVIETTDVP